MSKKKIVKLISIEENLWTSANKLRGSVEPSEYKHVVLSLIFLKFVSDKFDKRKKELVSEGKEKYLEMKEFYNMKNVFFLPEISRWDFLIKNSKQNDIALKIDSALHTVEKNNPCFQSQNGNYKDVPEYCYSATTEQIEKKDFSLVPSKYIEFVNRDENIDFDKKMKSLQLEFSELFKELGYKIEK